MSAPLPSPGFATTREPNPPRAKTKRQRTSWEPPARGAVLVGFLDVWASSRLEGEEPRTPNDGLSKNRGLGHGCVRIVQRLKPKPPARSSLGTVHARGSDRQW